MKGASCDILVVGAGPAGSSAAIGAAGKGARVLVVERGSVIGVPVRCAEYIPAPLLGEVHDRSFLVQSIRGMRTFLPGGEETEIRASGFTIRRDRFDQSLAKEAERSGAEIRLSTRALSRSHGEVLLREGKDRFSTVKAKIVIGADGPHSTVGRWIGSVNRRMIPAIQVSVPLVNALDQTEVYFDKDMYGGYGWLFPKGDVANVGVGMKSGGGRIPSIKHALDRLLCTLREHEKIRGEPRAMTGGWIPVAPSIKTTQGNVLLVGDAAGQTHPITGAGVAQAVICGRKAGKWAFRALERGDFGLLSRYEEDWRDHFGASLERASKRRRKLEREWGRLEQVLKTCWIAYREYYAGS